MSDSKLGRAVAYAVDAAAAFAVLEAVLLLVRCEPLRSANGFATALFASMGVGVIGALIPSSIVAALARAARSFRGLALGAGVVVAVSALWAPSFAAPWLIVTALVCARAAIAPLGGARFGRNAAAIFSVAFALVALVSSHAVRSYGASRGALLASVSRLAAIAPRPALAPPSRAATAATQPWPATNALVFSIRGLSADECASLVSVRVIARNAAVLVDARASATDPLSPWADRFSNANAIPDVRFTRCARGPRDTAASVTRCALDALATAGSLALAVDLFGTTADTRAIDGIVRATLQRANERAPLARSIVALSCGSPALLQREWPSPNDARAVVMLSAPSIRPSLARGAVLADELLPAVDALAVGAPERSALASFALHTRPWFDRAVRVRFGDRRTLDAVYTARYALHVQSARWYVALFDLDADPRASINRADVLPALTRAMLATP
ncbi:MAG: hypothetical protein JNK05_04785 [Myxococcales bacterium]|nr:hypothetical protein [Myxococcales bacterium]